MKDKVQNTKFEFKISMTKTGKLQLKNVRGRGKPVIERSRNDRGEVKILASSAPSLRALRLLFKLHIAALRIAKKRPNAERI